MAVTSLDFEPPYKNAMSQRARLRNQREGIRTPAPEVINPGNSLQIRLEQFALEHGLDIVEVLDAFSDHVEQEPPRPFSKRPEGPVIIPSNYARIAGHRFDPPEPHPRIIYLEPGLVGSASDVPPTPNQIIAAVNGTVFEG